MVGVKSKHGPKPFEQLDVEKTLRKMTIKEKVDILAGRDMVRHSPVPPAKSMLMQITIKVAHCTSASSWHSQYQVSACCLNRSMTTLTVIHTGQATVRTGCAEHNSSKVIAQRRSERMIVESWCSGTPASCFPSATGLGASWDVDLLKRIGDALGLEAKAKGAHVLLGPTINIQRSPLGGRGFESYSEVYSIPLR